MLGPGLLRPLAQLQEAGLQPGSEGQWGSLSRGVGHAGMDSSFPTVTQPSAVDFADLGQEALMRGWGCGAW